MTQWYNNAGEQYLLEAARVTGTFGVRSDGTQVRETDSHGLGEAIVDSSDYELSAKRACFILHYAINNPYEQVFDKKWQALYEETFMAALNVTYSRENNESSSGCVELLGRNIYDLLQKRVKASMLYRSVTISPRVPKNYYKEPMERNTRGKYFSYYVKLPGDIVVREVSTEVGFTAVYVD